MLKKFVAVLLILTVGGYFLIPTEVFYDSPNIKVGGGKVFYKNKPFTGKVLKKVPLVNQTIALDCIDGEVQEFPTVIGEDAAVLYEIPMLNKFIKINKNTDDLTKKVSIVTY